MEALGRDGEGAASVIREGVAVDHVDALVVARVDGDLAGVHGTRVPVAHQLPRVAPVLGAIDAGAPLGVGRGRVVAVPLLDAHVDNARVAAVDGDADAPDHVFGESARDAGAGQPLPGVAAVHAAVERAAGAASVEAPRAALALVGGGVDDIGLVGVERDVHGAGVLVDLQDGLPGGAAVGAAVEAALLVRTPEVAHGGDVDEVRVVRVQRDAPDMLAVAQPHVGPGLAAVRALVDAVAPRRTLPVGALPGADPDDGRVALVEGDRPDRMRALVLEHGVEGDAVVAGLVDAAGRGRDVVLDRVRFGDGQIDDAAAHDGGADVAWAQAVELGGGDLGVGGDGEEGEGDCRGCGGLDG